MGVLQVFWARYFCHVKTESENGQNKKNKKLMYNKTYFTKHLKLIHMKKLFIFLTASLFAVSAFAQFEQGAIRVGGSSNLGFTSMKPKGATSSMNSFELGVNAGYFFMDNLSADVDLLFDYSKYGYEGSVAETTVGIGAGVRYYLPINVFAGAGVDMVVNKYGSESASGLGANLKVGYAAFVTDNIAIEPVIGYRLGLTDEKKGTQVSGLSAAIGISLFF